MSLKESGKYLLLLRLDFHILNSFELILSNKYENTSKLNHFADQSPG
jgi:hypothetical protein